MLPQEVSNLDIAFGGDVSNLMPPKDEIPDKFYQTKYMRLAEQWFYSGINVSELGKPKLGIDSKIAMRHLNAIMGSWEPRHEDKLSAVAYLISQWFDVK